MFVLALAVLFSFTGCAVNPVTGQQEIVLISEQQELAYGREAHPQILAQFGQVEDASLQRYV
ncbi:MAG: peptidase, partial [Nitrospinota bacterium]